MVPNHERLQKSQDLWAEIILFARPAADLLQHPPASRLPPANPDPWTRFVTTATQTSRPPGSGLVHADEIVGLQVFCFDQANHLGGRWRLRCRRWSKLRVKGPHTWYQGQPSSGHQSLHDGACGQPDRGMELPYCLLTHAFSERLDKHRASEVFPVVPQSTANYWS